VEGVDFRDHLDTGGGERTSDGPEEAGPLAAEGEGLRHGATRSVSALRRPKQKIITGKPKTQKYLTVLTVQRQEP